ncbi:MAG TPA: S28 family serine protease [Tenuifilaceae bacterium]|nr:S28 family serine protease [Tenuifilaceae bacterium]
MNNLILVKNGKKFLTISFCFVVLFLVTSCASAPKSAQEVLAKIPYIDSMKQIEGDTLFAETWELWFSQPIDHKNPNSPHFPQKVVYNHKDFSKPMVVVIEGYTLFSPLADEPTKLLDANQITIEHRFFDRSRPKDSIPWIFLNTYQAATDQHRIIEAFKPFYKNKWVSTGISKGGQATISHRYYYPNDVDVSIPYVAPLAFSSEDKRFYNFLENVGPEECRERIKNFQHELFVRKEKLMPLLEDYAQRHNYTFSIGLNRAYDLNVFEYGFAFWQWGGVSCEQIPQPSVSDSAMFYSWVRVAPFDFFEDSGIENVRPFFYQAMTEIGMYGYNIEAWREFVSDTTNITFDFTMPTGIYRTFNPEHSKKVHEWIQKNGNNMLYIYGEYDPWTATAVETGEETNGRRFINPKGNHSTRIKSFPKETRDSIYSTLEEWLGKNAVSQKF